MTHSHSYGHFNLQFSFAEFKKLAIHIFSQNLHLLSFPMINSLLCFPLTWHTYEFFPGGHGRTPAKVGSNLTCKFYLFLHCALQNFDIIYLRMGFPRLPPEMQVEMAPLLIKCIHGKPLPQQDW